MAAGGLGSGTAEFDLAPDCQIRAGGTYPDAVSFSVTVYLNGAEKQVLAYGEACAAYLVEKKRDLSPLYLHWGFPVSSATQACSGQWPDSDIPIP